MTFSPPGLSPGKLDTRLFSEKEGEDEDADFYEECLCYDCMHQRGDFSGYYEDNQLRGIVQHYKQLHDLVSNISVDEIEPIQGETNTTETETKIAVAKTADQKKITIIQRLAGATFVDKKD